jgi:type IX secretion system PorP/SprF family membrane protein
MKKMKYIALLITALFINLYVSGQQDLMVSQYTFNHTFLNPAATGVSGTYNTSLMYRNQWVKFTGAPVSQFLSFDGPVISDKMGLGLLIQNEEIGVNRQTDVFANYSYIIDMDNIKLSLGLRGGLNIFNANYTEHKAWDIDDEILQENTTSYLPNFGFGVYLKNEKYYASVSIPHLLNYAPQTNLTLDFEHSNQLVRHYYILGGYRLNLSEDLVLEPSVLLKYVANTPGQLDGNLLFEYKELVSLGGGYRTGDSFIILTRFQINNRFKFGYSFDITLTDVKDYSKGSHEIMLNYTFGRELGNTPSFN